MPSRELLLGPVRKAIHQELRGFLYAKVCFGNDCWWRRCSRIYNLPSFESGERYLMVETIVAGFAGAFAGVVLGTLAGLILAWMVYALFIVLGWISNI